MKTKPLHSHHCSAILIAKPEVYTWSDRDFLQSLQQAAQHAGFTAVGELAHTFQPCGVSAVVLLQESHVALHFWPEKGKISVDIHICDFEHDNRPKAIHLAQHLACTLSNQPPQWQAVSLMG